MIDGWMSYIEQDWLKAQAQRCDVIIEIGCWKGLSTSIFCEHTNGTVFTIDNWQQDHHAYRDTYTRQGRDGVMNECKKNLKNYLDDGKLFIIEMDSIAALEIIIPVLLKHRNADMIFIDGFHHPKHVRREINLAKKYCNLICGHDYPQVKEGFEDLPHEIIVDGIWKLI